ncbi:MAG: transaldolase [Streptomycetaceae bacterium]|nr:MAG: transaldolase [Streptomycetaceae bacterium]
MSVKDVARFGTSIWLDDLSRAKITGTDPHSLPYRIAQSGVVGVTTNPSIFAAAIAGASEYADDIAAMAHVSVDECVKRLTTDDVRNACDLFRDIYSASKGVDGRVSIEVDPRLAHDTAGTIAAAKELWQIVDRPNVMIKVPATIEGLPAITELIAAGVSVNVTLIFSVKRYGGVIDAFISGIERATNPSHVHSVASFFVSRIDSSVDALLKANASPEAMALLGKAAIANAHLAYQLFQEKFNSSRWLAQTERGAHKQRPLWASTGVKDPTYDDTRYVVELIAAETVNTMPQNTLDAVIDHAVVRGDTISKNYAEAVEVFTSLSALGISLNVITTDLEIDGVKKFAQAWQELLKALEAAQKLC